MKNLVIPFLFTLSGLITAYGQPTCTPDPLYADSAYGVWPDTIEDFPSACLGSYYQTVLNFKIPNDAGVINPSYAGTPIDSAKLNSVAGLPPGLTYVCNVPSCKWNGGQQGCGVLYGTPTQAGVYDITINMTGYITVFSMPIGIPQTFTNYRIIVCELSASASSNVDVCDGDPSEATASGAGCSEPFTYQWSNGSTNQTASGLSQGSYQVTVTNTYGCTATASVNIAYPSLLAVDSVSVTNTTTCSSNDGYAQVYISGGTTPYSYNWSSNSTASFDNNLYVGTYWVTITDANGCTEISAAAVNSDNSPLITFTYVGVTCSGGSDGSATATVTNGIPPFTYQWATTPPQTGASVNGMTAGTYALTITDSTGCQATGLATVTEPAPINLTGTTVQNETASGNDGSITIVAAGGTPPYSYSWSPVSYTGNVATGLNGGAYSVTVTDNNGCTGTGSFNVVDGIYEVTVGSGFSVFPNPIKNIVEFTFDYYESASAQLKIHNILGEEVFTVTFTVEKGYNSRKIDIDLNNGVYIYFIQFNDQILTGKLSVIK